MPTENIELEIRSSRIPYFDLINKKTEKMKFKEKLKQFNRFLKSYGLKFTEIKIAKASLDDVNDFKLNIEEKPTQVDLVEICQNAKDQANMSAVAYKRFVKTISPITKLSSLYKCDGYKKRMNSFWTIKSNSMGNYLEDPVSKIKFVCQKFLRKIKQNNGIVKDNIFNILLSGDSLSLTRTNTNLLNFTFSLLNDGDLSYQGFYSLGIFRIKKEDYETVQICLKELLNKISEITEIVLNKQVYKIVFHSGGDLKWTSMIFGINSANSTYPCPFCTWKSKGEGVTFDDLNNNYDSILRTHQEALHILDLAEKRNLGTDEKLGYIRKPLMPFISFNKSVCDLLHLYLRISDKLLQLLFKRLKELEEKREFTGQNFIQLFCHFLEYECSITSPYYTNKIEENGSIIKKIELRTLNKNERSIIFEKLFENGSLTSLFPECIRNDAYLSRLNSLFFYFPQIFKKIKEYGKNDKEDIFKSLRKWLQDFIYLEPKITPYIHIFCFHLVDMAENFEDLNLFCMQGLEKLNSISKIHYFRQTNRHKNEFTLTLLEKINRMELIHLNNLKI